MNKHYNRKSKLKSVLCCSIVIQFIVDIGIGIGIGQIKAFTPQSLFNPPSARYYESEWKMESSNQFEVATEEETAGDLTKTTLITLPAYLEKNHQVDEGLSNIICQAAISCIEISKKLSVLPIQSSSLSSSQGLKTNVQGEVQKPMDVIANEIFMHNLKDKVAALASEEEAEITRGTNLSSCMYEIAFDPLDGSSNLDVSVPTGSIFGIAHHTPDKPFSTAGTNLVAAGYSVYSSSLEFVISIGQGSDAQAVGFTFCADMDFLASQGIILDKDGDEDTSRNMAAQFILSRPNLQCPPNGHFYSLNDGREPDWPQGLTKWVHDAKRGQTPSGTTYSSRYICSLCADFHRTILYGGWCGNPRPHLRLLYEAAPLAHIVEACGGRGSDGVESVLSLVPAGLHDRTSLFLGSVNDVMELESYGDVQQMPKTYKS